MALAFLSPMGTPPPPIRPLEPSPEPLRLAGAWLGWWVGPAFLGLAAYLRFLAPPVELPIAAPVSVPHVAATPMRAAMADPPRIRVGPYVYACGECHRLFQSAPERQGPLAQHTHIVLDHGLNDRCFNCHDRQNREKLVLRDASLVGFDQAVTLCSQCHGTTYRDWQRGMHGKTLGAWDEHSAAFRRLICTECHDPHHPAYPDFEPLPPPNTLRMGSPPGPHHDTQGRHQPLAKWRYGESSGHHPNDAVHTEEVP